MHKITRQIHQNRFWFSTFDTIYQHETVGIKAFYGFSGRHYVTQHSLVLSTKNIDMQSLSLEITDMNGKIVSSGKLNANNSIDISQYKSGLYIAKATDGNAVFSKKFVVE